eukprot:1093949-Prymnesium_polylepis.1
MRHDRLLRQRGRCDGGRLRRRRCAVTTRRRQEHSEQRTHTVGNLFEDEQRVDGASHKQPSSSDGVGQLSHGGVV